MSTSSSIMAFSAIRRCVLGWVIPRSCNCASAAFFLRAAEQLHAGFVFIESGGGVGRFAELGGCAGGNAGRVQQLLYAVGVAEPCRCVQGGDADGIRFVDIRSCGQEESQVVCASVACRVDEGGAALPILNVDIRGIGFCPQFLQQLRVRLCGGLHELFHGVLVLRPQQVCDAARRERQEQDEANDNQGFFHADSNLPRWRTHRGRER